MEMPEEQVQAVVEFEGAPDEATLAQGDVYLVSIDGGNGGQTYIRAADQNAAEEWADDWARGGSWDDLTSTIWVAVTLVQGEESVADLTVVIDPPEPPCTGEEHDWQAPIGLVGGIAENPGVFGHGGGVIMHEVCANCGVYRDRDTWAQDPETGEEGLESVTYRDADDASETWAAEGEEDEDDEAEED